MFDSINPRKFPDAEVRNQQVEDGRRMAAQDGVTAPSRRTLTAKPGYTPTVSSKSKSGSTPKGHEAFLKGLELSGAEIMIEKCDGVKIKGVVKCSDKYTISIREELSLIEQTIQSAKYRDRVIFKHDISEFSALTPRAPVADSKTEEGHAV